MISEANQAALHAARLSFILALASRCCPTVVREWRDNHQTRRSPTGSP